MDDSLPNEFDLVVIGTGFTESCIAAAASRIGKTVLHIDPNDFYGGPWASFNLEHLQHFLQSNSSLEVRNCSFHWHIPATPTGEEVATSAWTQAKLLEQSRRFNLDLCPKILYAAGPLVQLLISSNISRYGEFRAVDRVCTPYNNHILSVPCSRSDVFNSKDLSIIEKRLLMKFLTICMTYGEDKTSEDLLEFRDRKFSEYLREQKVTEKITTCVIQAIAMCDADTTLEEGMQRTQKFIQSLGRYGNTPFLFPMYGCGEVPQCFCRMCAVFGGIYCLKRSIDEITINADTSYATVVVAGDKIFAKKVVSSHGNLPEDLNENVGIYGQGVLVNRLSRGIFIASSPLGDEDLNAGGGGVNLLRLIAFQREAILIQLSHYSATCPKGTYVFHITTTAVSDDPAQDLEPFIAQVFDNDPTAPNLLYCAYFTLTGRERTQDAPQIDVSTPIFCTAAPFYELDYDQSIQNARDIFAKLYEGAEFLPRAPDPEEIVIDGEDPSALSANELPEDLRAQLAALENATADMEINDSAAATENIHDISDENHMPMDAD